MRVVAATITLATALALAGCLKPNPLGDQADFEFGGSEAPEQDSEDAIPDVGDGDSGDSDSGDSDSSDSDSGDSEPGDSSDSGDSGGSEPGDSDSGDSGPGDGDPDDEPDESGSSDDEPPDDAPDPSPDMDDEDQEVCAPYLGIDSHCAACLNNECCQYAKACGQAPGCECLAACEWAGNKAGLCKMQCGFKPEDVPELPLLLACATLQCGAQC